MRTLTRTGRHGGLIQIHSSQHERQPGNINTSYNIGLKYKIQSICTDIAKVLLKSLRKPALLVFHWVKATAFAFASTCILCVGHDREPCKNG